MAQLSRPGHAWVPQGGVPGVVPQPSAPVSDGARVHTLQDLHSTQSRSSRCQGPSAASNSRSQIWLWRGRTETAAGSGGTRRHLVFLGASQGCHALGPDHLCSPGQGLPGPARPPRTLLDPCVSPGQLSASPAGAGAAVRPWWEATGEVCAWWQVPGRWVSSCHLPEAVSDPCGQRRASLVDQHTPEAGLGAEALAGTRRGRVSLLS